MRSLKLVDLFVCLSLAAKPQEKPRSFYWQLSPNHSFLLITRQSPQINTKAGFLPTTGIGIGWFKRFNKGYALDITINYHSLATSIKSAQAASKAVNFMPYAGLTLYRQLNKAASNKHWFIDTGLGVAYELGSETFLSARDTLNNRYFEMTEERKQSLLVFAHGGIGLLVKRAKRDLLFNLQYAQGLVPVFFWNLVYGKDGVDHFSSARGRDSHLMLQCKFFLKNREWKASRSADVLRH